MGTAVTLPDVVGFNGTFWREDAAGGGLFTEIIGVHSITAPAVTRNTGNTTHLKDTAVQSVGGLPDLGEIVVTLKYDPEATMIASLKGDVNASPNDAGRSYVVGINSATPQYLTFTGPATGFVVSPLEEENEDPLTVDFTVKVNAVTGPSATAPTTA